MKFSLAFLLVCFQILIERTSGRCDFPNHFDQVLVGRRFGYYDTTLLRTALHEAAKLGYKNVTSILIDDGADVNAEDLSKWTPLHEAVKYKHEEVAKILIINGARVNATNQYKWTPLHEAAKHGDKNMVELLIYNGANVDAKDNDEQTPLFYSLNNEEVAEILIKHGANINNMEKKEIYGKIHSAARNGETRIVKFLIKHNADLDKIDRTKWSSLLEAILRGNTGIAELLIEHGAKINSIVEKAEISDKRMQLYYSTKHSETFAEVNVSDIYDRTCSSDWSQWSPLHEAVIRGNEKITEMLLARGALKNAKNKDGETPRDFADKMRNKRISQLFHEAIVRTVQQKCETFKSERIRYSSPGKEENYPWMAALGYINVNDNYKVSFDCNGIIISEKFVLTAAHCVKESRLPNFVRMGKMNLIDGPNDEINASTHHIEEIIRHPNYNSERNMNDIALIRVKNEIQFSSNIIPACLSTNLTDEPTEVALLGTGWFSVPTYNTLQKMQFYTMPVSECNILFSDVTDAHYCAYNSETVDTTITQDQDMNCPSFSGVPLQFFPKNKSSVATVIGIQSYNSGCGTDLPAIFTRLARYLDWLEPIVWPDM